MAARDPKISIDVKGLTEARRVVNPRAYTNAVERSKGKIRQVAYDIAGRYTPVITGTLKASLYMLDAGVGWAAPYAKFVNARSKLNAGYIDKAFDEIEDAAVEIVEEAVRKVR